MFKEVFEKHKVHNQFKTVILESRTRTQTKELKHDVTLKRVFGLDRPASAPPIPDINDPPPDEKKMKIVSPTNGMHKPWKSFAKIKFLMSEEGVDSDKDRKDFEEAVDFVSREEDAKDTVEVELENVVKKKTRTFRRKYRSSGFDYIRKKKKQQKKEDDEETAEEKEKKKVTFH